MPYRNYSVVIISAVLLFATVVWFCYSRKRYQASRHVHDGEIITATTNDMSDVDPSEKLDASRWEGSEKHAVVSGSSQAVV